jgi:hypothetical protein
MDIEENTITFNSGHKAHATLGIIGINSPLELSEGYDRRLAGSRNSTRSAR